MEKKTASVLTKMPLSIWALGFVSMFMDISSEIIHSLLPLFLTTTLGTSIIVIGIIEGSGESTALIFKIFSGVISDYLGQRKMLAVLGYALGAVAKPFFALASTSEIIMGARVLDRIGKGIRGAPRDALVADIAPYSMRGSAFGLRQALDTLGAVIGPLMAMVLMYLFNNHFRTVFWIATIPGVLAVLLLIYGVKEPIPLERREKRLNPISRKNLQHLGIAYWWLVIIGAMLTLARFSEAFLVLRAMDVGLPIAWAPFVMIIMSLTYSISAYPFGKLADNMSHVKLLVFGIIVLIAADLTLAFNAHWLTLMIGAALWGIHMGMTQGLLATMVADVSPDDLRGTAYGFFNLVSGFMMLIASIFAGFLWQQYGPASTFYTGAIFCVLSLIGLLLRHIHLNFKTIFFS
ncbi:MFS transporter [Legionella cardiaca]|uniref:MFS transporter n=1 Tax=Legionella cardiaca TaxID=1071983 RepID=A0ABY8AUG7_9GAMM|nr:MFS transporter [Legionella cardiaca]WED44342.1 MFS transporter [Legionella cardiaca]